MVVGVLRVTVRMPESHSLKAKRRILKGLIERTRHRYNVAVAEVDRHGSWQVAVLGIACVSTSGRHADAMLQDVLRWLEAETHGQIEDVQVELL